MELLAPGHLIIILAIAVFVFGPKKLPELGKGLGEGIRGFKDALNGGLGSEVHPKVEAVKQIEAHPTDLK
jgi:sec-independent protein translocase protein TatA